MARTRIGDPKTALGRQRAELRQGSRHKQFVGDDSGGGAGRAAELARVRRVREEAEARERERLAHEPISAILVDLVADSLRLARTLIAFPFRMAAALRGRWPSEA